MNKNENTKHAPRIAIDAHVIEGRPQGSRTTLTNILREFAALGFAERFALFCNDESLCRERVQANGFEYVATESAGSIKRLTWVLPIALRRVRARQALWQYISSPLFFGRNYVVVHDILPLTHPRLFPFFFRLRSRLFFSFSMFFADRIFVVSDFGLVECLRLFPFLAPRLILAPNGPSFAEDVYFQSAEASEPRPRPYILTVGRIEARKNIGLLVEAFRKTGIADVDLVLVGKCERGFSVDLSDNSQVFWHESIDDEALIALYRGASLFVFPSEAEGFGLPLLDAILFGIPTISSRLTAMAEIAEGAARLFDPTASDAVPVLSELIRGHFSGNRIEAPTPAVRRAKAERYNWRRSARIMADAMLTDAGAGKDV